MPPVSAAFARNLLQRLNRDLQGDADPTQFRYRAHWQAQQQHRNGAGEHAGSDRALGGICFWPAQRQN